MAQAMQLLSVKESQDLWRKLRKVITIDCGFQMHLDRINAIIHWLDINGLHMKNEGPDGNQGNWCSDDDDPSLYYTKEHLQEEAEHADSILAPRQLPKNKRVYPFIEWCDALDMIYPH